MQITDILELNSVIVPLEATEKYQAITELIDLLHQNDVISDYDAVHKAVMEREAIRSTGVGQGFAIPHGKTTAIDNLIMALGKTKEPIDFQSIDKQPVTIIVLLLSPADRTGPHIQALAAVSRLMTDQKFRESLLNCSSASELYQHIRDHETQDPT